MAIHSKHAAKLKHPLVLLLIAALLAGAVAWAAYYYLQQRELAMKAELAASKSDAAPQVSVVVSSIDAPANTVVDGATFVARQIEADLVYPDTVLSADFNSIQGQRLARPLLRGRPLRLTDLVAPEIHDVASVLPAGRRALTIEIDNLNSIAQTLRPNHHIDIFLLSKAPKPPAVAGVEPDEQALEQATLYMQNMVVLATGKEIYDVGRDASGGAAAEKMVRPGEVDNKDHGYDSVTLLVTPAEAARLMVGQRLGTFRVALRGASDHAPVALAPLRGSDLLPATQRRRDQGIEFIVGGKGDKLVSQLPSLPSQDAALLRAMQAAAVPKVAAAPPSDRITISVPATRANLPIPAVQKN